MEKLKDHEVVTQFRETFSEKITDKNEEGLHDWASFKNSITEAAEESIGIRRTYGGRKKSTPWWTEQVKEAVKIKMRAFRKWMKLRTPDTRREYITARTEAERINRAENRNVWRKIGDNLREDHAGRRKLLYSMAKNYRAEKKDTACTIKDKEGNIITEPERVMERWKEYFKELLNVEEEEIGGPVEYFQDINTEEIFMKI